MNIEELGKRMGEQIEDDLKYFIRNEEQAMKRKVLYQELADNGAFEPVIEYLGWVGAQIYSIHFNLPLDKPLFFRKVQEMKNLGWKESGALSLSNGAASQSMTYGDYPEQVSISLMAVGEGVSCRVVKIEEGQNWKAPTFEWVCEAGAEELDLAAEE